MRFHRVPTVWARQITGGYPKRKRERLRQRARRVSTLRRHRRIRFMVNERVECWLGTN